MDDARTRLIGRLVLVAAAYFGAAKLGLEFAFANASVTAVWAPTGLALAAVVLWGFRIWPAIAVGAFLANLTTTGPVTAALGIAVGNTLEAVVGAFLLCRVAHFRPTLQRVGDVMALVVFGAGLSTLISATIGVATLAATGLLDQGTALSTWRVWWLGDAAGDLIVAPALLILATRPRIERRPWLRVEALALFAVLIGTAMLVFARLDYGAYLIFPPLFWIAYRFGQPGTAIAGLIVSAIAVWLTSRGHGPFAGGSADAELLRAQTFVGVATITGLIVAAVAAERRMLERRLQHLADHDPLSGLVNRRRFDEELQRWVAYRARYGGCGAVLVLDLDNLKDVNDALGHAAGDELIARVGALLRERLRETDVAARLGGDEFTILLPRADERAAREAAQALLERIRVLGEVSDGGRTVHAGFSIGISLFGAETVDAAEVLARADRAMYGAKDAGRGRARVYATP